MMCAVSRSRTTIRFDTMHLCNVHNQLVDKDHINHCCLLADLGMITRFNYVLLAQSVRDVPTCERQPLIDHYDKLCTRIHSLRSSK